MPSVGLVALVLGCVVVQAGPLTPPAGTISSTGRPLGEMRVRQIVPANRTITQPGNYYLNWPVSVTGIPGIIIAADNVVLDLNGFAITASGSDGVAFSGTRTDITIRNGSIIGSASGVGFGIGSTDTGHNLVTVEDVTISGMAVGISVGPAAVVRRSRVIGSSNYVIYVGPNSLVEECQLQSTGSGTLTSGDGVKFNDVSIFAAGNFGLRAGDGASVSFCRVESQGATGSAIGAGEGSTVSNCVVSGSGTGIAVNRGSTVDSVVVRNTATRGVLLDNGESIISRATLQGGAVGVECANERPQISNCIVLGMTDAAVNVNGSNGYAIRASILSNSNTAVKSLLGASGVVDGNTITLNTSGVNMAAGVAAIIRNNFFDGNTANTTGGSPIIGPVAATSAALPGAGPHANFAP